MKRIVMTIFIAFVGLAPLAAQYPTAILGLGAEPIFYPDASGSFAVSWAIKTDGIFSLRTLVGEGGYLSLLLQAQGGLIPVNPIMGFDRETVSLETGFTLGEGKIALITLFDSSIQGSHTTQSFYSPDWELKYFFLTKAKMLNPYLLYSGLVKIEPEQNTDIFYQGGEAGFEYRPSALQEYKLAIGAGWESWYEYSLLTASGTVAPEKRSDFVGRFFGKMSGIVDFFFIWDLGLEAELRLSNANAYITASSFLNEKNEDALTLTLMGGFDWSPSRFITLRLKPEFVYTAYFYRYALSASGTRLDQITSVFSAGGIFHFDWTPDNTVYFFLELEGNKAFSNDAEKDTWQWRLYTGLKFSLGF